MKADQTITNIQSILKVQGYDIKIIDGIAGKNTVREIRNWQFLNNFGETGKINSQQLNILIQQNDNQMVLSNEELKIIQNRNQQLKNVEKTNKKKSYGKDFDYYMEKTIYLYITYFFIFILGTVFLLFSEKQTLLYNWVNIILYNQFSYIVIIFGLLIFF